MTFHLGKKEFIDNLCSDVLDLENSLRQLLDRFPRPASDGPTLRSWKYRGTSFLDVDTRSLVSCFRFNSRSGDESRKAHLIMTELLVDRLVAFLFVCASCLEQQILSRPEKFDVFEKKFSEKSLAGSVADYASRVYLAFLMAWGIGQTQRGAAVDADSQTEAGFRPHSPCSDCLWKTDWLQKANSVTRAITGQEEDLKSTKIGQKLKHHYDQTVTENKNVKKKTSGLEEKIKKRTFEKSSSSLALENTRNLVETLSKNFSQLSTEAEVHTTKLEELCRSEQTLKEQAVSLTAENKILSEELENTSVIYGDYEKSLMGYEGKIRTRNRVYELSLSAMQEKSDSLATIVARSEEKIRDLERIYDPRWRVKINDAERELASIRDRYNDSRGLLDFNESRIIDLGSRQADATIANNHLQLYVG